MDYSWMAEAACAGKTEFFFLEVQGQTLDKARRICAACPVKAECRAYGDRLRFAERPISKGLWGGLTVEELWLGEAKSQGETEIECHARYCDNMVPHSSRRPRLYCSPECARKESHARYEDRNAEQRRERKRLKRDENKAA